MAKNRLVNEVTFEFERSGKADRQVRKTKEDLKEIKQDAKEAKREVQSAKAAQSRLGSAKANARARRAPGLATQAALASGLRAGKGSSKFQITGEGIKFGGIAKISNTGLTVEGGELATKAGMFAISAAAVGRTGAFATSQMVKLQNEYDPETGALGFAQAASRQLVYGTGDAVGGIVRGLADAFGLNEVQRNLTQLLMPNLSNGPTYDERIRDVEQNILPQLRERREAATAAISTQLAAQVGAWELPAGVERKLGGRIATARANADRALREANKKKTKELEAGYFRG